MATAENDNSENLTGSIDEAVEQNHIAMGNPQFSGEEVRGTLEISASTGRFWQDWEKLKSILSYHLKQVLSEYPEAKMTDEQQTSSLGESFQELVKRLDDALHSFVEGPPFTLQRLCEILLDARSIYPKLSKFALAVEKNMLVTSMLSISTDPYLPASEKNSNGSHELSEIPQPRMNSIENGSEAAVGEEDEIMAEVEEPEISEEDTTVEMESVEEIDKSPEEANPTPTVDS